MVWQVSLSIEDGERNPASVQFYLADSVTPANVQAFAQAYALLLDNIIEGIIVGGNASLSIPLTGLDTSPVATTDREYGALFGWHVAGGYKAQNRVPTFDPALVLSGTNTVDINNTNVDAFIEAMLSGLTVNSTLIQPLDYRGAGLSDLDFAIEDYRTYRSNRRR